MSTSKVPLLDVLAQNNPLMGELMSAAEGVLRSGSYILGDTVKRFEGAAAEYLGVSHAIGVTSGTDALLLALMALDIGPGDEVITTPFTFFATVGCISRLGATPVFVDIDPDSFNIDPAAVGEAITEKTKAVIGVHLFGQSFNVAALQEVIDERPIALIEDAAQAMGASTSVGKVGSLGDFGCFSFFPSKNLGGFGDGGLVTTNDAALAEKSRVLRMHGSKPKYYHSVIGGNFRLDALQAALLEVKLSHLDTWIEKRRDHASTYDRAFASSGLAQNRLRCPVRRCTGHTYNQYVIRTDQRDGLHQCLNEKGIGNAIYYPLGLHMQKCFEPLGYTQGAFPHTEKACEEVLALPVYPEMSEEQQQRVIDVVLECLRSF